MSADDTTSDNDYRCIPWREGRCPACGVHMGVERWDGGTWTHHCGAVLKIGNARGLAPEPHEHDLYIWLVARVIQMPATK